MAIALSKIPARYAWFRTCDAKLNIEIFRGTLRRSRGCLIEAGPFPAIEQKLFACLAEESACIAGILCIQGTSHAKEMVSGATGLMRDGMLPFLATVDPTGFPQALLTLNLAEPESQLGEAARLFWSRLS